MLIKELCEEAFETAFSKGWHDEITPFATKIALVHSELSEALEADRRREGKERIAEELADVCIRVFDICGSCGFDLEEAIFKKMEKNKTREYKHGGKLY